MNRNVMIVLAGGFLIAVLVALLVQASLSGGKRETAPAMVVAEEPKVKIVVAKQDLKTGAELTDANMMWQDWPKNAVFPGVFVREGSKKPSEMVSGRLRRDVKTGEPIVESALVATNLMAARIGEGMRAFAIEVKASTMVGGFVGPGDYVDVILTYRPSIKYNGPNKAQVSSMIDKHVDNLASETILQNIKVLGVDQASARDEEKGTKVGKTVTLEVDYKSAEILALASRFGSLSLVLRRLGDEMIITEKLPITTDARITNIYDEVFQEIGKAETEDYSGHVSKIVRIYRGDIVENITVSP